jgi:hypothetical protein
VSLEERIGTIEARWEDLRTRAEGVPIPQWHKDLLDERERLIKCGEVQVDDWDTAKKRITEQTS